jgi:hypothetical protein
MKKFFVLCLLAIGMIASAQSFSAKYSYTYTATSADTANGSNAKSVVWAVLRDQMYFPTIQADIHELNGSATAYLLIEGSNDATNYELLDTCTTTLTSGTEGVTAATNYLVYQDISTGVTWKYLRARLVLSTTGRWHFATLVFRAVGKND